MASLRIQQCTRSTFLCSSDQTENSNFQKCNNVFSRQIYKKRQHEIGHLQTVEIQNKKADIVYFTIWVC